VHVNTLLLQQVLSEPTWASRLTDEDRRGPTALFWSNVNPYGTFRLDMDARLDLGPAVAVPRPRTLGQMPPPGQPRSCDEGLADLTDPCVNEAAWRARDGVGSG
jgi:hypothetical protein